MLLFSNFIWQIVPWSIPTCEHSFSPYRTLSIESFLRWGDTMKARCKVLVPRKMIFKNELQQIAKSISWCENLDNLQEQRKSTRSFGFYLIFKPLNKQRSNSWRKYVSCFEWTIILPRLYNPVWLHSPSLICCCTI